MIQFLREYNSQFALTIKVQNYMKRIENVQQRYLEARDNTEYRFEILKDLYEKEKIGATFNCKNKKLKKKIQEIPD